MSSSSTVPKTMRAVVTESTGGTEVLRYTRDQAVPTPKEDELLVRNHLVGVNYIDIYFRTGLYPAPKPEIGGREAVSEIVAVGPGATKHGLKAGDRVVWLGTSAYAEYSVVAQDKAIKVPNGVSDEDAVAGMLQGLTVMGLVEEAYKVKKGDTVLVHAAAGGVGLILVQVLKRIGARIVATAGGEEKCKWAKDAGADVVIDYRKPGVDWVKEVKDATNGELCEAVFDGVGKDTFDGSLEVTKRKGTLISFGNASGAIPPLTISRLSAKNNKLVRPSLFNYISTREEFEQTCKDWFALLEEPNKIKVKVHKIYPLEEAAKAQSDLEGRHTSGKLLLKP
ncbi:Alcohol dehydrogenase GroES-like domain-containing protein [Cladophialophora immunda]|nr:Alcohol dehydrogenase GroES-like domain-containing protein [Cladophialophora immunda]